MIIHGDCLEEMKKMDENSISAIITDPPYGLGFMNKKWDSGLPQVEIWKEALRIVKPGGFLLSFGGTRTFHRLTCAVEDAGWEIRDCIMWLYASGFPKSHNKFGIEGYGTALKPAHEPIILGQKPYEITHLIAIISYDLTNEIHRNICQRSSYNARDAEMNLNDSLALLNKVLPFTVQENVKIYAWEKLADANYVARNITAPERALKSENLSIVQENVNTNGCEATISDQIILRGGVEVIFANIQDIYISVITNDTSENIALLWRNILEDLLREMNRFTIKMALRLITELRTLKSCLSPSTSKDIGNLSPNYEPIIMAMKPLDGTFKQNAEKWNQAGINIDGCRIGKETRLNPPAHNSDPKSWRMNQGNNAKECKGRWPANLILDEFFEQVLVLKDNLPNDMISIIQEYFHDYKLPNLPKRNKYISEPNQKEQSTILQSSLLQSCIDGKNERGTSPDEGSETPSGINCSNEKASNQDRKSEPNLQRILVRERIQVHQPSGIIKRASRNSEKDDEEGRDCRTSNYDGGIIESSIETIRSCASSQRSEERQQGRESGNDGQFNPQNGTQGYCERIESFKTGKRTIEVLACDIPEKWLKYFEQNGKEILSPYCAAKMLDEQSGNLPGNKGIYGTFKGGRTSNQMGGGGITHDRKYDFQGYHDSGGASRFFYCAKASSGERNEGLDGMPDIQCQTGCSGAMSIDDNGKERDRFKKISKNPHPTVKPLKLMEYLIKLIMPPKNGILLDPFAGSGTTILAAKNLGFNAIGIEKEKEYCEIARARFKD